MSSWPIRDGSDSRVDKFNLGYPEFMVSMGHLQRNREQTLGSGGLKMHENELGLKMPMQLSSGYLLLVAGKTQEFPTRSHVTMVDKSWSPKDVHVLIPGTCEYYLTWQKTLCRHDKVKELEMGRLS